MRVPPRRCSIAFILCSALAFGQTPAAPVDVAPPVAPPVAVPVAPVPAEGLPRLAVMDLIAQGATPQQAAAMTDAIVSALASRKLFEVISTRDLETLLGAERQKQLLGVCETTPDACATDIGSAAIARFVLSGQLARVGSAFQLSLQMVDTQKGQPVARSTRLAADLETLRTLVPYAAAEATGTPLPPPPSRVLSVTLIAVGGGTFFAGGVVGLLALSRQQLLNDELCPSGATAGERCSGVNLHPRDFYLQRDSELATQKGISIGLMVSGAALMGVGVWLMPPAERASVAVTVVPAPNGMAVVGVFP